MTHIHVVAKARHAHKRWQRYTSYAHTAADAVAHLVLPELSRACMAMPIGFMATKGGLAPVAIQGLEPGKNLFVAHDGQWLADYIPAAYRSYPFVLGATEDGKPVLCVIENSGLLSDTVGEPFFDDRGEPAAFLKKVLDFMVQVSIRRRATQRICSVLQKHDLIVPWPFERQTDAGVQMVDGLHRVDRGALNALSADAFQELRAAGALPALYCHLLSMQHLPKLADLARFAHIQSAEHVTSTLAPAGDLDLEFLNNDGTLCFGEPARSILQGQEVYS